MQLIYHLGVLGWTFFLISYCVYSLMLMSMESWLLWMTVGTGCPSWNSIYLIGEAFSSYFAFELDFKQYTCISVCVCVYFVVVPSPSHAWLFMTPWTAACRASLSFIITWNLPQFMSIESVMPFKHLISYIYASQVKNTLTQMCINTLL